MADARNCAAPGGVRSTARLPEASYDSSSSAEQPAEPRGAAGHRPRPAVLRDPVDRRAAVDAAQLHRAELLQVPGQRRLGDLKSAVGQQLRELGLGTDRTRSRISSVIRPCRAALVGQGAAGGHRPPAPRPSRPRDQEHQQRLLRVQPVLRLVPHRRPRTVEHLVGDLPAAVRRQAVQHDRVVGRRGRAAAALTWYGRNGPTRSSPSFSCPIDVQVSVTTTSAPSTAACGSRDQLDRAAGLGGPLLGVQQDVAVRVEPGRATRSARSGRHSRRRASASAPCCWRRRRGRSASARPAGRAARRIVCRSASTWQGWNSSVSALITGTLDMLASALIRRCAKVRIATASTYRDSTREVSSMVSSRPSWDVRPSTMTGWPPSWAMPTSNDSRVRVEFFSKMTATDLPCQRAVSGAVGLVARPPGRARRSARPGLRSSSRRKCRRLAVSIASDVAPVRRRPRRPCRGSRAGRRRTRRPARWSGSAAAPAGARPGPAR